MQNKRKFYLLMLCISGFILLAKQLIWKYYPNLTFIHGYLTISYSILGYFAFSVFIISIPLLFKANKGINIVLGILLFLIFFINSCAEIFPLETETEPVDISTLHTYKDGSKLITREYMNAKTNQVIQDTVLVKDKFIFRQIIDRTDKVINR